MNKTIIPIALLALLLIFSTQASATSISSPVSAPLPSGSVIVDPEWNVAGYSGDNGYSAVQVTGMYEFNDPAGPGNATIGTTNLLSGAPYDATGRAAFFIGNDMQDDNIPSPSQSLNIGQAGDGLLNGDSQYWAIKNTSPQQYYQFDGLEFISADEFQALDPDGLQNDPGWIYLGDGESYGYVGPEGAGFDIGSVINISVEQTNTGELASANWTLTPLDGILNAGAGLLGEAYFDHLAIILKSSDYFAIYDLDFNDIFSLEGLSDDYFVPSKLTGTLTNSDLVLNGKAQAISHISFWAHDPANDPAVVPEPSTWVLLGASFIGLGYYRRRTKKS